MTRLVLYVAHPVAPTEEEIAAIRKSDDFIGGQAHGDAAQRAYDAAVVRSALQANLTAAMKWLSWLSRSFPETTFIAPWIADIQSGADDSDPAQRERGLVDCCAVVERCDGIVLVGPRISTGMARERDHGRTHSNVVMDYEGDPSAFQVYDLTQHPNAPAQGQPIIPGGPHPCSFVEWAKAVLVR